MVPFCVFTIYNLISSVPTEMDEAAVIDGAGPDAVFYCFHGEKFLFYLRFYSIIFSGRSDTWGIGAVTEKGAGKNGRQKIGGSDHFDGR